MNYQILYTISAKDLFCILFKYLIKMAFDDSNSKRWFLIQMIKNRGRQIEQDELETMSQEQLEELLKVVIKKSTERRMEALFGNTSQFADTLPNTDEYFHIKRCYNYSRDKDAAMETSRISNGLYCNQHNLDLFKAIYDNPEYKLTPNTLFIHMDGIVAPLSMIINPDSDAGKYMNI